MSIKPLDLEKVELEFEHEEDDIYQISRATAKKMREEAAKQKIDKAIELFAMSCGNVCDNCNDDISKELDKIQEDIELIEEE
jgi:hypothetical protein